MNMNLQGSRKTFLALPEFCSLLPSLVDAKTPQAGDGRPLVSLPGGQAAGRSGDENLHKSNKQGVYKILQVKGYPFQRFSRDQKSSIVVQTA